jgi:hypothetical protein
MKKVDCRPSLALHNIRRRCELKREYRIIIFSEKHFSFIAQSMASRVYIPMLVPASDCTRPGVGGRAEEEEKEEGEGDGEKKRCSEYKKKVARKGTYERAAGCCVLRSGWRERERERAKINPRPHHGWIFQCLHHLVAIHEISAKPVITSARSQQRPPRTMAKTSPLGPPAFATADPAPIISPNSPAPNRHLLLVLRRPPPVRHFRPQPREGRATRAEARLAEASPWKSCN